MTRLTKDGKEMLVKIMLTRRFGDEAQKLANDAFELAGELFAARFTAEEHALSDQVPRGWLREVDYGRFVILGESEYLHTDGYELFAGVVKQLNFTRMARPTVRVAHRQYDKHIAEIKRDDKLASRYKDLARRAATIKAQIEAAEAGMWSVLRNCPSIGTLIKVWPEIEPHVPATWREKKVTFLPAVNVQELNRALELP